MDRTKQTRHRYLRTLSACVLLFFTAAQADDYRDARAELVAAYQQADYAAMMIAADKALVARPGFPGGLFNLAMTQVLSGDPQASLQTLQVLLVKGVDFGADEMQVFAALRELDEWDAYVADVESLYEPIGEATVAVTVDIPRFVPEGIAINDSGDVFLGSIRTGALLRATDNVHTLSNGNGHWSVFGMRFHCDGSLWFASAAVPQFQNIGDSEGQTGLFRIDPESGNIMRTAILPQSEDAQVLGDLIIADDNTIYATDSLSGTVYRYFIDGNEFEALVERGELGSPHGLVLDESGQYLYVADYIGGLFRIALEGGDMAKLNMPDSVTDYGIDGLYRYGEELIAIRNGVRPHRVIAMKLSDDGLSITSSRTLASNLADFDEPTLGVVRGDDFYFVANSHWNRFDAENNLPDGLTGPIILKVAVR